MLGWKDFPSVVSASTSTPTGAGRAVALAKTLVQQGLRPSNPYESSPSREIKKHYMSNAFLYVGLEGFEPSITGPKPDALPLGYSPIRIGATSILVFEDSVNCILVVYSDTMKSGYIYINKPAGISSFKVIIALRKKTGIKKIGHAGTLDPFATGLLICAIGREATRTLDAYLKKDKKYRATVRFGMISSTGDPEGEIRVVDEEKVPTQKEIEEALNHFMGTISQTPPSYSAIHINGVRAYDLARQGITVEMPSREVVVHGFTLVSYQYPFAEIEWHVGSGTYIRTLAQDLGDRLGVGAYLTALRRTDINGISLDMAVTLEDITPENWETFIHSV